MSKRCLINVDLQHDFITGSLALKNAPAGHDAEALIPCINILSQCADFDLVVYSLDYHPPNHISFVDNYSLYTSIPEPLRVGDHMLAWTADGYVRQQLWPKHCVWHTEGARLWPTLFRPLSALYVYKGTVADIESYSVFGNDERHYDTGLHALLQGFDVGHIYFTGIAEDICVAHSALDALRLGYAVTVIEDATCGVSEDRCIAMKHVILREGGHYRSSAQVLSSFHPSLNKTSS